jgi:oligopeptide/dipeptide ABC transporter ATP-binding protein
MPAAVECKHGASAGPPDALLRVRDLRTWFPASRRLLGASRRHIRAVDGVSFDVQPGGAFGLIGESGCGKSTLARTILRLIPATSGEIRFEGVDLRRAPPPQLRALRRRMQVVFQDPAGSLNPRLRVEQILSEGLEAHRLGTRAQRRDKAAELLGRVGLSAADLERRPHEFSGGQRQRIGIARALTLDPSLVICDEPVSALDVSIQAQILNLLADLRRERGLTYLFISHDLGVVRVFCDQVAVMYLGRIVEQGAAEDVLAAPAHPYTQALLAAAPRPDPALRTSLTVLPGEPPSPSDPPSGCAFHPRCPLAIERCRREAPELKGGAHRVACHLAEGGRMAKQSSS